MENKISEKKFLVLVVALLMLYAMAIVGSVLLKRHVHKNEHRLTQPTHYLKAPPNHLTRTAVPTNQRPSPPVNIDYYNRYKCSSVCYDIKMNPWGWFYCLVKSGGKLNSSP